jgi:hypothetical protein
MLCNFDEFWIYDFNHQLEEPLDRLRLEDLPRRWEALAFLLPAATGSATPRRWSKENIGLQPVRWSRATPMRESAMP